MTPDRDLTQHRFAFPGVRMCLVSDHAMDPYWELETITVSTRHRRKGVGTKALTQLKLRAIAAGKKGIRLLVLQSGDVSPVDLVKFYEANGFTLRPRDTPEMIWTAP